MSLLVSLTEEGEIKKVETTSSAICITFLIAAALAIIGLIYYGATAAYWGTVVDKYVIEEKVVVEYDETLNAEVTITYPARYVVVVKCEDAYYKFETNRISYENMHIGSFTSTGTKAGAERIEKKMNEIFKQGEEAMYGLSHVIVTGAESAFGVDTYFIMYADGTMKEIEVDDKSLKKIEPVIIHSEFNQILLKLWEKDKDSHCIDYF